jgi:Ribbon-helix-helix protein, copG family
MATAGAQTARSRKSRKQRDVRATFLITAEQRDALDRHTERTGVTMSRVVRRLLEEWAKRTVA